MSHYSATTVCLSPCFTVVHFTELAGTLHFDYVSARQQQRGEVKDLAGKGPGLAVEKGGPARPMVKRGPPS